MLTAEQLGRLYRYGLALVRDPDAAHDLLHNALLRCLEQPDGTVLNVTAYVRRSMRNGALDRLRAEQRWAWQPLDDGDEAIAVGIDGLERLLIAQSDIGRIWRRLSPAEREVLFLWAVEGFTVEEIAQQTGVARGTLLSRLHRLRKRIRALDEDGGIAAAKGAGT